MVQMTVRVVRAPKRWCLIEEKEARADLPEAKARKRTTIGPKRIEGGVAVMEDTNQVEKVAVGKRAVRQTDWSVVCSFVTDMVLIAPHSIVGWSTNPLQR